MQENGTIILSNDGTSPMGCIIPSFYLIFLICQPSVCHSNIITDARKNAVNIQQVSQHLCNFNQKQEKREIKLVLSCREMREGHSGKCKREI